MSPLPKSLLAAGASLLLTCTSSTAGLGIVMPVYTETNWQFDAAYAAAEKVPFVAIINPNDGPGTSRLTSLRNFSNGIRARGGNVIGYINSYYGGLSWDEGEEQMNAYYSFYSVNGYFIDEVATNKYSYYNTLRGRASGRYLVLNPGTNAPSSYSGISGGIITYENPLWGDQSSPFLSYGNSLNGSATLSGAIIYSTGTAASMRDCVDRAIAQGYDYIYVTDDGNPNPFDSVPSYWTEEINYIARSNLPAAVPAAQFKLSSPTPVVGGFSFSWPTSIGRTYEIQVSTDLSTWTTATRIDGTKSTQVAPGNSMSVTVKSPAGSPCGFFRAADVTP
jgi:Spherulation-specific family 4